MANKEQNHELEFIDKSNMATTSDDQLVYSCHLLSQIRRCLVPENSKRALICKLLLTVVCHPVKFFRSLTPRKFKKFFRLLKRGNIEGIKLLVNSNITGQPAPSALEIVKPEVVMVDVDAAKGKTISDYPVQEVPQFDEPQVSIIIPVFDQFEYTYHCVSSILNNSGDAAYEILVADDCSTDLTGKIECVFPGVRRISNETNQIGRASCRERV